MLPARIQDTADSSFELPDRTCRHFTLAEIQSATENFDSALVIGRGGFGMVYRSSNLIGSVGEVAIKRLDSVSNQGAVEYEAEIKVLSKLRHCNLVSLIGYCNEGREMVLVYDYMPNGTLGDHLHKADKDLSWLERLEICVGAARGLDYLHTGIATRHGVTHRDVKSSNILLDANFAAKISDFGLAKVGPTNQTRSYVSTGVKGTFGYMDPCYFYSGKLTRKSDVYAFGVVLFEVLSGRQAVDPTLDEEQWGLAAWAQDQIKDRKLNQIIDSRLMGQISRKCLKAFARIAVQCLHNQPKQRPTMAEIVVKLEFILSEERKSMDSAVNQGRFINTVRSYFAGKVDLKLAGTAGRKSEINAYHIQKSNNGGLRTFKYAELEIATDNFTFLLGSDGFGKVYKGVFSNGNTVAVKVLNGTSDKRIEEQFMAEVSTMGRTHHFNLVRLYGFCFDSSLRALVYEFMINGSLDHHLFKANKRDILGFEKLHEIALGTAKGITYLHEECPQRIVHFDIKPGNVLLDSDFNAKVGNFGLAKLCNRDNTHITMTRRGTPGYAAPEFWMPLRVTHKCDVYSFGMLLFEIIGKRRNMDVTLGHSQEWFPIWVWEKYKKKQWKDLMMVCEIEEKHEQVVERMVKVALYCVQYRPETRPTMSVVVKMLEGALEVPETPNFFSYLFFGVSEGGDSLDGSDWSSSEMVTKSTVLMEYLS